MELKKYARADSEQPRGLFILLVSYLVFASLMGIYYVTLSFGNKEDLVIERQVSFQYADMQPVRQEETFLPPPPPPPPPKSEFSEVLNIVDTIIEKAEVKEVVEIEDNYTDESDTSGIVIQDLGYHGENGNASGSNPGEIFIIVEKMPVFPGGEFGLRKYIAENVKYPELANKKGIEGIIYIRFCITSLGTVEQVSVARGVNPLLDNEAMRVVQSLPNWAPGEQRGKKVNVWYTVPINFSLN